jgi:D-amino-acid dehydrogenase
LNDHYVLAFDDARIVVGATREFGTGIDYRTTAAGVAGVLAVGLQVTPGLADAEIIETRIGFRPMAFDNRPLAGKVDAIPGLLIANGLGHSGLTLGPYFGKLMADVTLGRTASVDMAAFDPLRQ